MTITRRAAKTGPRVKKRQFRVPSWMSAFNWTAGALVLIIFSFPMIFMAVSSLKPSDQIFIDLRSFDAFLPVGDISFDNYVGVFQRVPVAQFMFNSIFISVFVVGLGLVVNSLAGFAIARTAFRGRGAVLTILIATLIVPFETIAIPMVYLVANLPWLDLQAGSIGLQMGMFNTYAVQILPITANAFSIFLFVQYFKSIPKELDEAAIMDGAGWFTIYRRVISPLAGPAFATSAILTFLPAWNAYLWPIMVVQQEELRPVQVGLQYFFQLDVAWGEIMAYATLISLPVIILFISFQRAFVASIAASGVKG